MIPGRNTPNHPTFKRSFLFAIQGFRTAVRQERNIKVMLAGGLLALVLGIALRIDLMSWLVLIVFCGLVISAELMNTALEAVVDLVSPEFHPLAGKAKDIAAAAVWFLSLCAALAGILIFASAYVRLYF